MDNGASHQLTLGTYQQQPMAPSSAYNSSPGQSQPPAPTAPGTSTWRMNPHQQHPLQQHQHQQHQQHQHQHQHQHHHHQHPYQYQQQQHSHQPPPQHQHQQQQFPQSAVAASQNPNVSAPASGIPTSPQALMNALGLLQQNISALQSLIPLMAQQQQQHPSDTAQAQQLQQQQAAASASVASVISQLALAASNIIPQMGVAPPALPQIGVMAPSPVNPSASAPTAGNFAGNSGQQLLMLPQHGGFQSSPHPAQHQSQQQQPQPFVTLGQTEQRQHQPQQQEQQFVPLSPSTRQKQLISSLGESGSLLQQQAAHLTLATQPPPTAQEQQHQRQNQRFPIKLSPSCETEDVAAKLQLSQPGFAPSMPVASSQQAKPAIQPKPAALLSPPLLAPLQPQPPAQVPAQARQFPKQGAVDKLLGDAIVLSQKRKLAPDGDAVGNGAGGSDLVPARKKSKEDDAGGRQRGTPEEDEEDNLPEGSYDIIEMDPVELLAEHTHFCEICGKGFKRDANLRMHMRGHGDEYKTPEALARPDKHLANSVQRPKRFSCPFAGCKRNSQHARFLPLKTMLCVKNHYRRTHCPKMLACSKCGAKRFSVVADLKTHEKHCGRGRWLCSCGTSFSRKDKLLGHLALFKGHRPATALTADAAGAAGGAAAAAVPALEDGEGTSGVGRALAEPSRVAGPDPASIAGPSSAPGLSQMRKGEREVVVYQQHGPSQLTLGQPVHNSVSASEGQGKAFGVSGPGLVTADLLGSADKHP